MKPLVVNVAELLRRPGTGRDVNVSLSAEELELIDERVAPSDTVDVGVKLESLTDGIVVTGTVSVPWSASCRRCLIDLAGSAVAEVDELYQHTLTSDEAFPIVHDQIDLAPMVRELATLELPLAPLCRPDCAGLCPTCGANRNEQPCGCAAAPVDDRWSALDALREQLN